MSPKPQIVIHNQPTLHVRTGVKAGGLPMNHNSAVLRVRTGVKAGALMVNHNETGLRVRSISVAVSIASRF